MISTTFAIGLANGSYVSTQTNANLCELQIHAVGQTPIIFLVLPLKDVANFKDLGVYNN